MAARRARPRAGRKVGESEPARDPAEAPSGGDTSPVRDLESLRRAVVAFRDARDWRQFHNPKDLALSLSLEAAELLEHFQWKDVAEVEKSLRSSREREAVADEMADIQSLLLALADVLGVDLHEATLRKLRKAARKYPVSLSRGSAKKYHRLKKRIRRQTP